MLFVENVQSQSPCVPVHTSRVNGPQQREERASFEEGIARA